MLEIAEEGAKVLHNRSIEIAKKYKIPIITKSTFTNAEGTIVQEKIENSKVKSIVKNDDLILINLKYANNSFGILNKLYTNLLNENIFPIKFYNNSSNNFEVEFLIKSDDLNKFQQLLNTDLKTFNSSFYNISKISIIGYLINKDPSIIKNSFYIISLNNLDLLDIEITESKITFIFKEKISNKILEQLHQKLII